MNWWWERGELRCRLRIAEAVNAGSHSVLPAISALLHGVGGHPAGAVPRLATFPSPLSLPCPTSYFLHQNRSAGKSKQEQITAISHPGIFTLIYV